MKKIKKYNSREEFAIAMIDKYFKNLPSNVVSDIGAGYGYMQKNIEKKGFTWQPFDYYKKIEKSIVWDLNNPSPNEVKQAGGVIFLEVLEHLANPLLGIQNIANHLKKDGVLVLTTPNPQSSKNTINLFLKGTLYAFQTKHLKEHHVFTPWKHIVEFFLKQEGFEILEYGIVDVEYQKRKSANIKDFFKKIIERYLEKRNEQSQGMSYGLVAVKK